MLRYVHLGTGNYNPRTASLYTDVGLLTCDPDLGKARRSRRRRPAARCATAAGVGGPRAQGVGDVTPRARLRATPAGCVGPV